MASKKSKGKSTNREEDLITQSEAADMMGKSLPAVNELVRRGRLRSVEKYGKRLVSRSDAESFEDERYSQKGG
jgi:hypothetical protein